MTAVLVSLRDPWPPHQVRAVTRVGGLRYGFGLNESLRTVLDLSDADPNVAALFEHGAMVTLERSSDKLFPWVGYITERDLELGGGTHRVVVDEYANALFSRARTRKDWGTLGEQSIGELIKTLFGEAQRGGSLPVPVAIDSYGGPDVEYTPRAESLLDVLRDLARVGYEWTMRYEIDRYTVNATLVCAERLGSDHRSGTVFQGGAHFNEATLHQQAEGLFAEAVVVGGTGTFADRPAATATIEGRASGEVGAAVYPAPNAPLLSEQTSPIVAGSRVITLPSVTNQRALASAARALYSAPDYVRERLSGKLVEGAITPSEVELGGTYTVRFDSLAWGLNVVRDVRFLGLSFGEDGMIGFEADVLRARRSYG